MDAATVKNKMRRSGRIDRRIRCWAALTAAVAVQ
jgi:hypothetical protein